MWIHRALLGTSLMYELRVYMVPKGWVCLLCDVMLQPLTTVSQTGMCFCTVQRTSSERRFERVKNWKRAEWREAVTANRSFYCVSNEEGGMSMRDRKTGPGKEGDGKFQFVKRWEHYTSVVWGRNWDKQREKEDVAETRKVSGVKQSVQLSGIPVESNVPVLFWQNCKASASKDTLLDMKAHKPHCTFITFLCLWTWLHKFIQAHLHLRMHNYICSHLMRCSASGRPGDEVVPKMAGAISYWSQGADVCQRLTHSSLLSPPTSCSYGEAHTLAWSMAHINYKLTHTHAYIMPSYRNAVCQIFCCVLFFFSFALF